MKKNIFFVCTILFVVAAMHASDETAGKFSAKRARTSATSNPRRKADAALGEYMLDAGKKLILNSDASISGCPHIERGFRVDFGGSPERLIVSFKRARDPLWGSECTISLTPGVKDSNLIELFSGWQAAFLRNAYRKRESRLVETIETKKFSTRAKVKIYFDKDYIPGWSKSINEKFPIRNRENVELVVPDETRAKMVAALDEFAKKVQDSYKEQDDEKGD